MIVVTGSARTGTSMMMQTLKHLGYPMAAPPFIKEHKPILKYNERGFYELTVDEIIKINMSSYGKALKVFGQSLPFFDTSLIYKLIVMKRNREDAIESSIPVYNEMGEDNIDPEFIYDSSYKIIDCLVDKVSTIFINFEDIIAYPEREVNRLVEFLDRDFDKAKIDKAINNIKQ